MLQSTNEVFWRDTFTAENQKRIAYLTAIEELHHKASAELRSTCICGRDLITGKILYKIPNKNSMAYTEYAAWKAVVDDLEMLAKLA